MFRQYTQPRPEQFDTPEEYNEALEAYDAEECAREEYAREKYYERQYSYNL